MYITRMCFTNVRVAAKLTTASKVSIDSKAGVDSHAHNQY